MFIIRHKSLIKETRSCFPENNFQKRCKACTNVDFKRIENSSFFIFKNENPGGRKHKQNVKQNM